MRALYLVPVLLCAALALSLAAAHSLSGITYFANVSSAPYYLWYADALRAGRFYISEVPRAAGSTFLILQLPRCEGW